MAIKRGISGAVNGVSTARGWIVNDQGNPVSCGPVSNTDGGDLQVAGNTDWNGVFRGYGYDFPGYDQVIAAPIKPGDTFVWTGSEDGTNGCTGNAIMDSVTWSIDPNTAEPIWYIAQFSGNGTLTWGAASVTDAINPSPKTPKSRKISFATPAGSLSYTDITDLLTMKLTLWCENDPYVVAGNDGVNKRVAGPKKARLQWTQLFTSMAGTAMSAAPPTRNTPYALRLYVTSTLYWQLNWFYIASIEDVEVDINGKKYVGGSMTADWSTFTDISSVSTRGVITSPDGTSWWS